MGDGRLRERARDVERSPGDPGLRLLLARELARTGASAEAIDALYRARALGAPASEVREGLRALRAPPSPWPQLHGTSFQSRCAPIRGPRTATVTKRKKRAAVSPDDAFGIVDEDASWVRCGRGVLHRYAAGTLTPRSMTRPLRARGELFPALGPRGAIVAAAGAQLFAFLEGRPRVIATGPTWTAALPPVVDASGDVIAVSFDVRGSRAGRARVFSAAWEPIHEFDTGSMPTAPAVSDELVALVTTPYPDPTLRVFARDGRLLFERQLPGQLVQGPLLDARGRPVVLVIGERVHGDRVYSVLAFEKDGRLAWTHARDSRWIVRIAAAPDGAVYLLADSLERIGPDGGVSWIRGGAAHVYTGLVVDRDGVVYSSAQRGRERALVAHGPDGALVLEVPGTFHPLALDGRGRLLALAGREHVVVAVG